MSDEAKNVIKSLQNGTLPPLKTQPTSTTTNSHGIDNSQRSGLDATKFGLQTINEGVNYGNNKKDK